MALTVESVFFYPLENAIRHKTDKFEIVHMEPRTPVIRRGQSFNVAIRFAERDFIPGKDDLRVIFKYGSNPHTLKGTKGVITLSTDANLDLDVTLWCGKILSSENKMLMLELMTPVNSPFGPWEVEFENARTKSSFQFDNDLWLLFNPWEKLDLVYMQEEKLLGEYILSDVGKIWVGPYKTTRGREWIFGQFDSCVLPACVLMLDRAGVLHENRGDPILLSRAISRIVNSNDDHGVLVGRWDGNYGDGIGPSAWTGSVDILDQFLSSEQEVKYGQCWVFAGVLTTVCRALGIPSRVISNLVSAHDSNLTLTIDKYYDSNYEELDFDPNNPMGEDSVWNFHVWNDVYMARPDLPKGYGGWQAVDATPQEPSNGMYQCGPASLQAIKEGAVGMNYDVPFLISSVNADFMKWQVDETSPTGFRRIECSQNHIGKMILTKLPYIFDPNGDGDREDITDQYKAVEGSKDERLYLFNAVRNTTRAKRYYDVPETNVDDIKFSLTDLDKVDIGQPFVVVVTAENVTSQFKTIEAFITAQSVYYTGVKAKVIKKSGGDIKIPPKSKQQIRMTVKSEEYIPGLVEYAMMKILAICKVKETKQIWGAEDDFQIITPDVIIDVPQELNINETVNCALSVKNPLDYKLTNCVFSVAGPGLIKRTFKIPFRDIRPKETARITVPLTPFTTGEFKIVSTFASKQLSDITGRAKVEVF